MVPCDPTTNPVIESRNDMPSIDAETVFGTGVLQDAPPSVVLIIEPSVRTACAVMASVATTALIAAAEVVKTCAQLAPPLVDLMILPPKPLPAADAMYPVFASGNEIDLHDCVVGIPLGIEVNVTPASVVFPTYPRAPTTNPVVPLVNQRSKFVPRFRALF